jgi:hypothetical protein
MYGLPLTTDDHTCAPFITHLHQCPPDGTGDVKCVNNWGGVNGVRSFKSGVEIYATFFLRVLLASNGLELSHAWPSEQMWIMKIVIFSFKSAVEHYTKVDMHQMYCDGHKLPRVDIYIALIFWPTRKRKMKLKYILTQAACHKIICPSFNPSRLHALLICQLEYEETLTKKLVGGSTNLDLKCRCDFNSLYLFSCKV